MTDANDTQATAAASDTRPSARRPGAAAISLIAFFGVILPAFTLGFELLTGVCRDVFFDPLPSIWHVLLVAWVAVANALALLALGQSELRYARALGWLNGIAAGAAFYYTLVFLPVMPFALIGVLWFGFGLLPLSPLTSFVCALALRRRLRLRAAPAPAPAFWRAAALALAALVLLDLPKTVTYATLRAATGDEPVARARAVRALRHVGSRNALLRACYGVQSPATDMLGFIFRAFAPPPPIERVRDVYYRVTGSPYNAVQPPDLRGLGRGALINGAEWDFDQAGDAVNARVRGLSLAQSRLDGTVDAAAGTAYTEWTLEFRNASAAQREARAELVLPPGAVVSRVTLWIDGQEREAAYGPRQKVKEAYQRIVARRRDPVLVTTSGRDRVLAQCFPVPPNGGAMKTRVGITAPLALDAAGRGRLRLPYFNECNFAVAPELRHALWLESEQPLAAERGEAGLVREPASGGRHALRGPLADGALAGPFTVRVERPGGDGEVWAEAASGGVEGIVVQRVAADASAAIAPARLVIVVDGSRRMRPHAEAVAAFVARLPAALGTTVLVAGDDVEDLGAAVGAAERLRRRRYEGGCDNLPALLRAWDAAAQVAGGAILWIHATQPVELTQSEELVQRYERRPEGPVLYSLQLGTGPDRVGATLGDFAAFRAVPGFGDAPGELDRLLAGWTGAEAPRTFVRALAAGPAPDGSHRASAHVARLWVHEEVQRLALSRREDNRTRASQLATAWHLVTPVSGAVVLETQQQYKEAGLEPIRSEDAPGVVPEPGTLALAVTGVAALWLAARWRARVGAR